MSVLECFPPKRCFPTHDGSMGRTVYLPIHEWLMFMVLSHGSNLGPPEVFRYDWTPQNILMKHLILRMDDWMIYRGWFPIGSMGRRGIYLPILIFHIEINHPCR